MTDSEFGPVDLDSNANDVRLNPRFTADQRESLTSWLVAASRLSGHVFVLTSGSTAASDADFKWVALSKQALRAAAAGSNQCLGQQPKDVWLHPLPDFHVGGIGIWARAALAGVRVVKLPVWDPAAFAALAETSSATLSSLVPAQLHDLVTARIPSPKCLRAVLIGGAALPEELDSAARILGWPIRKTYGMTETASQTATEDEQGALRVLPHLEARIRVADERIEVRGESLFTGYVSLDADGKPHLWDPKDDEGWFTTEDIGQLDDGQLSVLGRTSDRIKIGGEVTNLARLRRVLDSEAGSMSPRFALCAVPDPRLEAILVVAYESGLSKDFVDRVIGDFNRKVLPFERVRDRREIAHIPRTDLGKIKQAEISMLLSSR